MRLKKLPGPIGLAVLGLLAPALAATAPEAADSPTAHVPWSRQANLYEVNVRQFSAAGTLAAVDGQLARIHALGVDIVWLMPIQPIGTQNRKGSLGSYYSIRDYTAVNPQMGSLEDVKRLVAHAHALGMHVILDWVANHTAWDHPWTRLHPDWYKKDAQGGISPVIYHPGPHQEVWSDVVALDYRVPPLRTAMIAAMQYWITAADIDGFRCDIAAEVPTDFWVQARRQLGAIKPLFLLAEADAPALHEQAFDMSYDWTLFDLMRRIAQGKEDAAAVRAYLAASRERYPASALRMLFTTNHDKNSWEGSDVELFGASFQAMAVLAATLQGMPLVYGGQEARLEQRLAFFEKDPIAWKDLPLQDFYRALLRLRHDNPALAAGPYGGAAVFLETGNPHVLAFERVLQADRVTVVINLSAQPQRYRPAGAAPGGDLPTWGWSIRAEGGDHPAQLP